MRVIRFPKQILSATIDLDINKGQDNKKLKTTKIY